MWLLKEKNFFFHRCNSFSPYFLIIQHLINVLFNLILWNSIKCDFLLLLFLVIYIVYLITFDVKKIFRRWKSFDILKKTHIFTVAFTSIRQYFILFSTQDQSLSPSFIGGYYNAWEYIIRSNLMIPLY